MKTYKDNFIATPIPDGDIAIITPCFNENKIVIAFLNELCDILKKLPFNFTIVVIDDASTDNTIEMLLNFKNQHQNINIKILSLKYNVGHQGAIYQGFLYAHKLPCNRFIVIDSDGEDDPVAISKLVYMTNKIVNVVRGKRLENKLFRILYKIYKAMFRLITGKTMNFGNYCMLDKSILDKACDTSFFHLAAYLSKQDVDKQQLKYNRMKRIGGSSKMSISSLVHHAFRSFVEYAEDLLMVFLKVFIIIVLVILFLLGVVFYKKVLSDEAILGWASTISISLLNSALICLGFFVLGILLLNISNKNTFTNKEIFLEIS